MKVWYVVHFGTSKKNFQKEFEAIRFYSAVLRVKFKCKIVCYILIENKLNDEEIVKEIVLDEYKGENV